MKNQIITFLSLICLLTLVACKKNDGTTAVKGQPNVSSQNETGTVDGGGGDAVTNPNTGGGQLLDLAEAAEKNPFDFDIETLLKTEYGEEQGSKRWDAFTRIRWTETAAKIFKEDAAFYSWAIDTVTVSNSEKESASYSDSAGSLYDIAISAFDLKGKQIITNVKYGFTDKKLTEIADEGDILVDPTTKRQLAVQDGFGNVLISRNEFAQLDVNSKIALKLHESALYLVLRFNPGLLKKSGTAPIRRFVADFFKYTYLSGVADKSLISADEVRASWLALGMPSIKPDYTVIGKISDTSPDSNLICELTRSSDSQNYYFSQNGKAVSGAYAMDVEFFMRIQLHLVKKGICVFKPKPCEVKSLQPTYQNEPYYHLVRSGVVLPDPQNDAQYIYDVLLAKYRVARICE
ncbi:MAG: hypothetical protein H7256_01490 [Bdellovibrio sp.]|nr:hypothetical protein [Bdellovibrio sp.]